MYSILITLILKFSRQKHYLSHLTFILSLKQLKPHIKDLINLIEMTEKRKIEKQWLKRNERW